MEPTTQNPVEGTDEYYVAWMFKNGVIDISDTIYEDTARTVRQNLDIIETKLTAGKAHFEHLLVRMYACAGGGAGAAFAIYDMLRNFSAKYDKPVRVEAYGFCASAAAMIVLQAGDERLASTNTYFLLHEVRQFSGWDAERLSDIADKKEGMDMAAKLAYTILSKGSRKPYEEVYDFIDRRERFMTVEDALEWNLIDGIIE